MLIGNADVTKQLPIDAEMSVSQLTCYLHMTHLILDMLVEVRRNDPPPMDSQYSSKISLRRAYCRRR